MRRTYGQTERKTRVVLEQDKCKERETSFITVCACVCVCGGERDGVKERRMDYIEREGQTDRPRERQGLC